MSPKTKVLKQEIIDAAFDIAAGEGLRGISVRKVAKKLNCSVAPIYVNFENSEDLINAVIEKSIAIHLEMCTVKYTDEPFLNIGIGNIMLAHQYSKIYKDIVAENDICREQCDEELNVLLDFMKTDKKLEGFNDDELKEILFKMRTFTSGLCAYASCENMPKGISVDYLINALGETGNDVIQGALMRKKEKRSK